VGLRAFLIQDFFFLFSLPFETMELFDGICDNFAYCLVLEEAGQEGRLSDRLVFNSFGIMIGSDSCFAILPEEDLCCDLTTGAGDPGSGGNWSGGVQPREDIPELLLWCGVEWD